MEQELRKALEILERLYPTLSGNEQREMGRAIDLVTRAILSV